MSVHPPTVGGRGCACRVSTSAFDCGAGGQDCIHHITDARLVPTAKEDGEGGRDGGEISGLTLAAFSRRLSVWTPIPGQTKTLGTRIGRNRKMPRHSLLTSFVRHDDHGCAGAEALRIVNLGNTQIKTFPVLYIIFLTSEYLQGDEVLREDGQPLDGVLLHCGIFDEYFPDCSTSIVWVRGVPCPVSDPVAQKFTVES